MALVFTWIEQGKDSGHVALLFAGRYVNLRSSKPRPANDGPWRTIPGFDDDVALHGRMPHLVFQIKGLNEDAMLRQWRQVERNGAGTPNPAGAIAAVTQILRAGMTPAQAATAERLQRPDLVQLHSHFVTYVYAVSLALRQGIPMNLMRRKDLLRRAFDRVRKVRSETAGVRPQPLEVRVAATTAA